MAVGEQDRRPVGAHDDAGCAGGIVGDVIFLQVLIVDAERAAGEDGKIFARGGQVEDLFVGGQTCSHRTARSLSETKCRS